MVNKLYTDFDLEQIIEIQNQYLLNFSQIANASYVESIEKTGFFITPHTLADLKKDGDILIGIKEKDKVIAYIWVSPSDGVKKEYTWSSRQIKEKIFGKKNYYINQIGVLKSHQGKGFGGKLLENLSLWFTDKSRKYIVASVAYYPIKNKASIGFNLKHGFKQVAISPKVKFHQFENYQSVLLARKISTKR
jgi:GNAT superfamily N-acetyltransferase